MEQTIGKSDIKIGVQCNVVTQSKGSYINARLYSKSQGYKKFANLTQNDVVYVLTEQEHKEYVDKRAKINELDKELNINKKETDELNNERITQLQKELDSTKTDLEYWKNSYKTLNNEYEDLENENSSLTKNNEVLEASNTTFKETIQSLQEALESKEKELKETSQNHQLHIDEITDKYQSLLPLKEYIEPKQHYDEIDKLKDKIKASENEVATIKADGETKLAKLQQELETKHTEDKAQLLVAYNNDLNNYKMQYNELAIVYNQLLEQLQSLTRINTLLGGRHNEIKKEKEKVELLELPSEHLEIPMEKYVPKQ